MGPHMQKWSLVKAKRFKHSKVMIVFMFELNAECKIVKTSISDYRYNMVLAATFRPPAYLGAGGE